MRSVCPADFARRWRPPGLGRPVGGVLLLLGLAVGVQRPAPAHAQGLTQVEALRLAFPRATGIDRRTAFLEDAQLERAARLAGGGVRVDQPIVTHYVGTREGRALGVAYFDAHRVRTMQEVIMIVVGTEDEVQRIEILSFAEPPEYMAPEGWLDQFDGEALSADLALGRRIRNISGATLTSRAITEATRRVLALHRVIDPFAASPSR